MNNLLLIASVLVTLSISAQENTCDFEQAIKAFHDAQNKKAIQLFNQCVDQQAFSIKSHFYLGVSYRNLNELIASAKHLKVIVGEENDNISYYLEYAFSLEKLGQLDQALSVYEDALTKHPANLGARLGEARLNHWLGHINQSISLYRALALDQADNIEVMLGLAFVLMADRKLQESEALFDWVLAADKDNLSAKKGVDMLRFIYNYSLTVMTEYISFDNKSTTARRLEFVSTPDYSLKWGIRLIHYNHPIDTFSVERARTNRSVLKEFSIFSVYKSSENNEVITRLTAQDILKNHNLYKIKLEDYYTLDNKNQIFIGVTQSFLDSESINTLSTIGVSIKRNNKKEFIGRLFYSADKYFQDSQTISISMIKTSKRNDQFQFGASANQTGKRLSTTVFGVTRVKLFKNFNLVTNLIKNSKDKYLQLSIGVKYEF
jgi:tetratricopeptide (TPR) repeat protein